MSGIHITLGPFTIGDIRVEPPYIGPNLVKGAFLENSNQHKSPSREHLVALSEQGTNIASRNPDSYVIYNDPFVEFAVSTYGDEVSLSRFSARTRSSPIELVYAVRKDHGKNCTVRAGFNAVSHGEDPRRLNQELELYAILGALLSKNELNNHLDFSDGERNLLPLEHRLQNEARIYAGAILGDPRYARQVPTAYQRK